MESISPEDVLRLNKITENYLCPTEANVYGIDFTRLASFVIVLDNSGKTRPGVNFTNVLCAAFTYVSCPCSFFVPTLEVCTLLA